MRVNPLVKYGHLVIMMFQSKSINFNKCMTLMGDVESGEAMPVV
jgi:hypothetical protein